MQGGYTGGRTGKFHRLGALYAVLQRSRSGGCLLKLGRFMNYFELGMEGRRFCLGVPARDEEDEDNHCLGCVGRACHL